ncbi:unnamed protein product, partial [Natator depressus]
MGPGSQWQQPVPSNPPSVGNPCPNCRKCNYKKCTIVLAVALAAMFLVLIIVLADGWIGYRGKCYYFSEAERNWTYRLTYCSVLSTSLAEINSEQEMAFLLRYKGKFDHWIGLRRDPGQLWKWANGTKFNNL